MPDATLERWTALLEELERDLLHADADGVTPWRAPTDLGPLPDELLGRARKLLTAQQEVMAALEEEKDSTRRHLSALRALPQQRNETAPLYLDASG